jgi:hypothetical protein
MVVVDSKCAIHAGENVFDVTLIFPNVCASQTLLIICINFIHKWPPNYEYTNWHLYHITTFELKFVSVSFSKSKRGHIGQLYTYKTFNINL